MNESDALKKFNDVAFDLGKLFLTLSVAVIVVSVSFQKIRTLGSTTHQEILFWGWGLELTSIILGTLFLFAMLRAFDIWSEIEGYYWPAIVLGVSQYLTFLAGLICIALHSGLNF